MEATPAPAAAPAADGAHSKAPEKERRPSLSLQGLESSTLTTGKTSGRIYGSYSLYLFPVSHPVRRFAIQAIEWKWFDRIVLLLIVINCVRPCRTQARYGRPARPNRLIGRGWPELGAA